MNPETIEEIDWHLEVRYHAGRDFWGVSECTDNNILAIHGLFDLKTDAMTDASRISAGCVPIKVYGVDGEYQHTEVGSRRLRESKPD